MKATDYAELESNKIFKKKYLNKIIWWKSIHIVPPTLFLFFGLFGLLYLMNYELLISYYTLPLLAVFVIGTIWLKAVKRHLHNTMLDDMNTFKVCAAFPICVDDGYTCFAFVNGQKRHNEHSIKKIASTLSIEDVKSKIKQCKKAPLYVEDKLDGMSYFLISYPTYNIGRQNMLWEKGEILPLLFINAKNVAIIKGQDITK